MTSTSPEGQPGAGPGQGHRAADVAVEVLDFDPKAREKTFRVKIAAAVQPVPPDALPGAPVRPVVLEGLTVTPYIKDGQRGRGSPTRCGAPVWRRRVVGPRTKAA